MATQKGNPRHSNQADLTDSYFDVQDSYGLDAYQSDCGSAARPRVSGGASQSSVDRMLKQSNLNSEVYASVRRKRKRRKIIMGILIACVVLVFAGGGAAFAYIMNINNNLHSGVDENLLKSLNAVDTPTDPFYMLLLGIDKSSDRQDDAEYEGDNFRSDSMILARIDPKNRKATLVSIRRDVLINNMGGYGGYGDQKINAAHSLGGPALAVQVVSELAGVPIAHYAEIDFDGFREVIDTLGGIEVDVPIEIDDEEAGGYVPAGLQTLNGQDALTVCRSRHAYDNYGEGDNYRAANQRMVLSAIAQKLLASDIAKIASTATAISKCITTDMNVADIVAIAQSMQGINSEEDIYSAVIPAPSAMIGGIWYDIVEKEAWQIMMSRVNAGLPPTDEDIIDEMIGTVMAHAGSALDDYSGEARAINADAAISIRNGNGVTGITDKAAQKLSDAGYSDFDAANANSFSYSKTVVVFRDAKYAADAKIIAKALGVGEAKLDTGDYLFNSDVLVVLGSDFS